MKYNQVLEILDLIASAANGLKNLNREYAFIHKQGFIKYKGRKGRLVWDYLVFNELTFEDEETGEQISLGLSASDSTTEAIFNELIEKYGVGNRF